MDAKVRRVLLKLLRALVRTQAALHKLSQTITNNPDARLEILSEIEGLNKAVGEAISILEEPE